MLSALYKRELSGFLYGRSFYCILAVYWGLSIAAAIFLGLYFVTDNPSLRSYFAFQPQILLMIVPALAMKMWSEERKNGMIEVLMTLPIKDGVLILARFFAGWTVCLLMLLLSLPLIFVTASVIDVDKLNIISAFIGALLASGMLTALGCAVCGLNINSSAAYLLSVLLGWTVVGLNLSVPLSYVMRYLSNAPFFLPDALNFSYHYQGFLGGQLNLSNVFYFVSAVMLFLFFNWVAVKNRRG